MSTNKRACLGAGGSLELGDRADDTDLGQIGAGPDWQRRAPEAAAANGPVMCGFQPIVEALLLDVCRHPRCLRIARQQLRFYGLHPNKPTRHRLQNVKASKSFAKQCCIGI